jgi:hypothetical protein
MSVTMAQISATIATTIPAMASVLVRTHSIGRGPAGTTAAQTPGVWYWVIALGSLPRGRGEA